MDLPDVMSRYADRFAGLGGADHHVASPLGAWLVLALAASAGTGECGERMVDALGVDAGTARAAAADLLADPHPAVSAAAAAWMIDGLDGLRRWRSELPTAVQTGPIPTQDQADRWARDHTLGLIEKFPLDVGTAAILLASALATKVTWLTPFEVVDAARLGGPWSSRLTHVLHAPPLRGHQAFITDTARAGRVAVHTAAADGLQVTSVIADADVAPVDVQAAAHSIALSRAGHGVADRVSLFDLTLDEHPLWAITQEQAPRGGQHVEALLPAWHADSEHKLLSVPALAFDAAGQSLQILAGLDGDIDAVQTAVARYSRRGFEAAAVTALAVAASARVPPPPGPYRTATVRFAHPYAVVATTLGRRRDDPWHALPVFSAWVAEPDDAAD